MREKVSNFRDKKNWFISEQAVFHSFLLIVKDMINILLYKYIYVYANVYKYSLKVLQEWGSNLKQVTWRMDWKKCLLLSGQYKIHNKLSAVTFKSLAYWKLEVAVPAFVAKTTYCSEIQSQRLTADKLSCFYYHYTNVFLQCVYTNVFLFHINYIKLNNSNYNK